MATKPTTRPAALTPLATVGDALLEKYKDYAGIKVVERRFQNPDLPGSLPTRLKDEPSFIEDPTGARRYWYVRWIDGAQPGRTSQVIDGLAYVPVKMTELQNDQMLAGMHKSDDGVARRGDKGLEWLAKIPLELYTEIKSRQQEKRARRDRNAKLVKEDLAHAAGRALGSEAGDAVHDDLSVSVSRSRSTYGDELHDKA